MDALGGPGGRNIGDAKARVRMGRAQQDGMQGARRRDVGDVTAFAADEGIILLAGEALGNAEPGRVHGFSDRTLSSYAPGNTGVSPARYGCGRDARAPRRGSQAR